MKEAFLDNIQIHSSTERIGLHFRDVQGLESPGYRLSVSERPATDGAFVANQLYGGRPITIIGKVTADDVLVYRARRRTLELAVSRKLIGGELIPRYFKFKTMDDLELQVPVYTRSFVFEDKGIFAGNYKVDLYSPEVYLEGQLQKSVTLYIFSGGGMAVPMPVPMSMANGGSTTGGQLENLGNVESYPIITFHGAIENPNLINMTTGESMDLTYDLAVGERIVVDTKNRTALFYSSENDPEGENVLQYISGDWLNLVSGTNVFRLITAAYNGTGRVTITWRDKLLGI